MPRALTQAAFIEASKIIREGGWTGLDPATIQAVRGGAQPGDPLPPRHRKPFIRRVADDAEVIIMAVGRA